MGVMLERNGVVTGSGNNGVERTRLNLTEAGGVSIAVADGLDPIEAQVSLATREGIMQAAEGLKGQNFPRQGVGNTVIMIDGTVYYMGVGLVAGDVVTTLYVAVTTAGTAVTLSKVALTDSAGNRLAISADQGSAWNSSGIKEIALISPFTVVTTGAYYLAVVSKASTTLPTMGRGASNGNLAANLAAGVKPFGVLAGQTDIPTTAAIVTTNAIAYWMGWS